MDAAAGLPLKIEAEPEVLWLASTLLVSIAVGLLTLATVVLVACTLLVTFVVELLTLATVFGVSLF